ncbi:MAG: GGDEF domain-containing protein [Oscillospiraceae bacterium]|nr:GGDEF domain-containing protein [Oscillospiraceae bacterium]
MAAAKIENHSDKIKKTKLTMIIGYAVIIVIAIMLISVLTLGKTSRIMEEKVKDMTSALNVQLRLNINSYLSKLETTGTLIFATPEVYEYDAIDHDIDEYDALNLEDTISDKLMELCIMENYVDFGIVYSNNHSIGKLSNGTANLFGDELYSSLEQIITRNRTSDGWATGCRDDYKRIYYVKRVNDNAVFVASFYTTELENVFVLPENMNDMTVRLVNENNNIIFSSADDEPGSLLSAEITDRILNYTSAAVVDDNYLITVDRCSDNWRVICSIPRAIILEEMNDIRSSTIVISFAAAAIAILMGIFLSIKVTNPMGSLVSDLDSKARIDRLTGVNNKRSFEEAVEKSLSSDDKKSMGVLLILDVDNFKGVNDTLGHSYGDKVLENIGVILKATFRSSDILGRIGGDEFAVYMSIPQNEHTNSVSIITARCEALCAAFRNNYTGEDNSYKISTSIGAAIADGSTKDFASLYKNADKALYSSKHKGKDTYTIYSKELQEAGEADEN